MKQVINNLIQIQLGDGTWVQDTKGRVLVAYDQDDEQSPVAIGLGETLGEAQHILTVEEMPRHTHTNGNIYCSTPGTGTTSGVAVSGGSGTVNAWYGDDGETGNGYSHNNIQPSIGVCR